MLLISFSLCIYIYIYSKLDFIKDTHIGTTIFNISSCIIQDFSQLLWCIGQIICRQGETPYHLINYMKETWLENRFLNLQYSPSNVFIYFLVTSFYFPFHNITEIFFLIIIIPLDIKKFLFIEKNNSWLCEV